MSKLKIQDRSDNGRVAVNGIVICPHDNYTIETDEELTHPDDPRAGRVIHYAVCEECGAQGDVSINNHGHTIVDWSQND